MGKSRTEIRQEIGTFICLMRGKNFLVQDTDEFVSCASAMGGLTEFIFTSGDCGRFARILSFVLQNIILRFTRLYFTTIRLVITTSLKYEDGCAIYTT